MTKRFRMRRLNWTAWLTVPVIVLMAAGAFADAAAQTRVRQNPPERPSSDSPEQYVIDCPKEKSKKVTLPADKEEITFTITSNCLCTWEGESAGAAKEFLSEAFEHFVSGLNGGPDDVYGRNAYAGSVNRLAEAIRRAEVVALRQQFYEGERYRLTQAWFRGHSLHHGGSLTAKPPPGGTDSKTRYCWVAGKIYTLFWSLASWRR